MNALPPQEDVAAWRFGTYGPHRVTEQAYIVAARAEELCRVVASRGRSVSDTDVQHKVGDVVIALLALAQANGFDLTYAVGERWAAVRLHDMLRIGQPA